MITLHARVKPGADTAAVVTAIKQRIETQFGIDHVTVEIEHEACADEKDASDQSSML